MKTQNEKLLYVILSYAMVLIIFINLSTIKSPFLGVAASIVFFLINGAFLGFALSENENPFFRFLLGTLLLVGLLGLISWAVMIIYNLDTVRSAIALLIVATVSSFIGSKIKHTRWNIKPRIKGQLRSITPSDIAVLFYLVTFVFSFYLLFKSRSGEVYTVWGTLHPAFIPAFFGTTLSLLAIVFSSKKAESKLLLIVTYSILSRIFFVAVFPAGDVGGQQLVLGETRLVFDNVLLHGWPPWPVENVLTQVYYYLRGDNFQTALSVIFARMLGMDVFWTHLLLVPVLWGTFVPVAMFKVTKSLGQSDNISVFSGLLLSLFPLTIYWGTFSVPFSIGFIFLLFAVTFFLKYLHSSGSKTSLLMMVGLSFVSFLAHFLTGIISFSLFFLAIAIRKYESEKNVAPRTAKAFLLSLFIFSASLLPLVLIYQRLFYPFYTYFTLEKLSELSVAEILPLIIFEEYINLSPGYMLSLVLGQLIGLVGMLYLLHPNTKQKVGKNNHVCILFLSIGFLMFLVDYRILKLFMADVPFQAERIWLFRDVFALPFLTLVIVDTINLLLRKASKTNGKPRSWFSTATFANIQRRSLAVVVLVLIFLSSWITASLYYAYPHYGPLQTTSYELEAVKHIDTSTKERYIVIGDLWAIFAGEMFVGVYNPRAFYFSHWNPDGTKLFLDMKTNPSPTVLMEAMKINNATIAYFIIQKPRLGTETYHRIIQQAQQNDLQTFQTFSHEGEEKLRIYFYRKE